MWKWQIFGKRKSKQNTKELWVFGSRKKFHQRFYMKSFSKNPFKKFQNFSQKAFILKDLKENPQRGSPKFPKNSFKENRPLPKSSHKILKSSSKRKFPQKVSPKNHQKVPRKSPKKISPFHNTNHPFIEEDFENIFK